MKRLWLLPLAFALVSDGRADPAPARAAWTVFVYMDADNNLEHTLVQNLIEMGNAKASDRVRVVVECDRSDRSSPEGDYCTHPVGKLGDFQGAKRLVIGGPDAFQEIADLGAVDMGDPKSLADFLAWGGKAYPAEHTLVILADHGFSWSGWGDSEKHDRDGLTLLELGTALEAGRKAAGIERFDLVGFDSCLMAHLEVMNACRPHARYLVASEELEPGYGWDYSAWLPALAAKPEMSPEDLGKLLCDSYRAFFENHATPAVKMQGRAVTLSLVDLERIPGVVKAVEAVSLRLESILAEGAEEAWDGVARAQEGAEEYGKGPGICCHAHDLHHFAARLAGLGLDAEAAALKTSIEAAVLHRVAGADRPHGRGISFYFPPNRTKHEKLAQAVKCDYAQVASSPQWVRVLQSYFADEARDIVPPGIDELASSATALAPGDSAAVTACLKGGDVAEAYFALAAEKDGRTLTLGRIPIQARDGRLEHAFNGSWLALGDGRAHAPAAIATIEEVEGAEDRDLVGVPVLLEQEGESAPQEVTLYFELDWSQEKVGSEFVYAFRSDERGPAPISIDAGDRVRPMYVILDDAGDEEFVGSDQVLTVGDAGLDLLEERLPPGEYEVGFWVEDFAGNVAEDFLKISWDRKR